MNCEQGDIVIFRLKIEHLYLYYRSMSFVKETHLFVDAACEIALLRSISHPRIIKLLDVQLIKPDSGGDAVGIRLIMPKYTPLVIPGDKDVLFNFRDCLQLIFDISLALAYLRANYIMHRDIKEHNIVIDRSTGRPRAILVDFGLASFMIGSSYLKPCSTVTHRAPEISGQLFNNNADVWSLGLVIYAIVTGHSWKDMAYDSGMFTSDYEEKEWLAFMTAPDTPTTMADIIKAQAVHIRPDEREYLTRLMRRCLQLEEHRCNESDIILSILRNYPKEIDSSEYVVPLGNMKMRVSPLPPKLDLCRESRDIIKSQVSYIREHIYGALEVFETRDKNMLYTLICMIVMVYDVDANLVWDPPSFEDVERLYRLVGGDFRKYLFSS